MIKNYFKTAWRTLLRNKLYSVITISGLSLAMAGSILLLLWIQNALSVDQFHAKSNLLYKLYKNTSVNGYIETGEVTPPGLAPALMKDHQEINATTRVFASTKIFSTGDKKLMASGNVVDPAFLTMFSFPLERGSITSALNNDAGVVVTEDLAKKLFPGSDAMNKTLLLDGDNFIITGILKNLPNNTQFNFEFLVPWKQRGSPVESWTLDEVTTYAELDQSANETSVNLKISEMLSKYSKNDLHAQIFLYPFSKTWLYGNFENGKPAGGGINTVYLLFGVAFIILFIGCINFMNLSTARGERRAKEIGVRKIAGASKSALIKQFIGESILMAFIAGAIALLVAQWLLPPFNNLTEKHLEIGYYSFSFWLAAIGFVLFTGLLAGSYPAFFLSSFKTISILKRPVNTRFSMLTPRKILVVIQFTVSIIMINYSYVLIKQTAFVMKRDTGFLKENLLFHPMTNELQKNFEIVKQELLNTGKVISVNKTNSLITSGQAETNQLKWNGNMVDYPFRLITSNAGFVNTNGMELLAGRDIDINAFPSDTSSCVINEAALKTLGIRNAIGNIVEVSGSPCTIVGIVKDFVNDFPGHDPAPLIVRGSGNGSFITMRLHLKKSDKDIDAVNAILKKYNVGYITEAQFASDDYARKFKGSEISVTLTAGFTIAAIFISCLGLFGLGIFMVSTRTKEIGIRKVLGATTGTITYLLTIDFIKLVAIAIFIGSPIAWLLMKTSVQNFAYRINVDWWILVVTAILTIIIALVTVAFKSIKAAVTNPVKSLRTE